MTEEEILCLSASLIIAVLLIIYIAILNKKINKDFQELEKWLEDNEEEINNDFYFDNVIRKHILDELDKDKNNSNNT